MTRSLRMLRTMPQATQRSIKAATALFWLAMFALLLQFLFSGVVMDAVGLGSLSGKFHPASYLLIMSALVSLAKGVVPLHVRLRDSPGLMLFVFGIPMLGLYSTFWTGISGSAIYLESYLTAGCMALLLEPATAKQKRILAYMLIILCVFNGFVAVYESLTTTPWFPMDLDPDMKVTNEDVNFRANAFFNHPLSASLVTSMAIFLLYGMHMRFIFAAPAFGVLLVGLLAYGGRTALAVTILFSSLATTYIVFSGVIKRNLRWDFILVIVVAIVMIPMAATYIINYTHIADRIMDTLYYDDSAQVRSTQWRVLNYLSLQNWLFGMTKVDLDRIKVIIGLADKTTDIENFWLLMLLQLGVIGFTVFLFIFGTFLHHLARYANTLSSWMLMLGALIIESSSNSLGVRTNDLLMETAFLIALAGFRSYVPARKPARIYATPRIRFFKGPEVPAPMRSLGSSVTRLWALVHSTDKGRDGPSRGSFMR